MYQHVAADSRIEVACPAVVFEILLGEVHIAETELSGAAPRRLEHRPVTVHNRPPACWTDRGRYQHRDIAYPATDIEHAHTPAHIGIAQYAFGDGPQHLRLPL